MNLLSPAPSVVIQSLLNRRTTSTVAHRLRFVRHVELSSDTTMQAKRSKRCAKNG
jgi:hypothetical protein